jgi:hypothetical protein
VSKGARKAGWAVQKISDVAVVFDGPQATLETVEAGPIFLGIGALQDGTVNLGETRHLTAEDSVWSSSRLSVNFQTGDDSPLSPGQPFPWDGRQLPKVRPITVAKPTCRS